MSFQVFVRTFTAGSAILVDMEATLNATRIRLTAKEWLICAVAGLGFAFDLYEVVVQAIVLRPMLMELGPFQPGTPAFNRWAGWMLFLPAIMGGVGGLVGGYLTDRIGRQRVLVWSIVLYGIAAFMSGHSATLVEVILWRCLCVAGTCIEFVAAIAWLSELFPEPRRRETVLGFAQVCASIGNILIAGVYFAAVTWGDNFPAIHGGHAAWRYALIFGALPAIPLMIARPFLPESPVWRARHAAGTLRRPHFRELFAPRLRRTTLVCTLLVACGYALAFGVLQHIPRVVPGLPQVALLPRQQQEQWVSWVHLHADIGAIIGRLLLAGLVVWFASRRPMLKVFVWTGLLVFPLALLGPALGNADVFKYAVLLMTMHVSLQYSFWGNYLPRVFPLHLRGTGESFALSFGGRVLAPLAALATTNLSNFMPGATPGLKLASSMALVAGVACVIAIVASHWLPEPDVELLED